jgi:hypothetical protein
MSDTDYKVQSIVFEKDMIGFQEALDWVVAHGDKVKKIDETETQYRFTQLDPNYLKRRGYTEYRTKRLNDVVSLILAYRLYPLENNILRSMEYVCRCGCITYTQTERRKHLRSRSHYLWQKHLEYISNN